MVKSIKAENFQSWEHLVFNVSKGVTLVDGWNEDDQTSEGSGKSAVLNALSWGLYGKLPKDVKVDEVVKFGKKSCSVAVEFDGCTIKRTRKPNDLVLIGKEGNEVRGKDMKETQSMIEDFLGLSFEAFCQSIYFAQNYDKKFLSASQEDKAKILSEIQDLNSFDKARKEVMSLIKIEDSKLNELNHKLELIKKDMESIDAHILHEKQLYEQAKQNYEQNKQGLSKRIEAKKTDLRTLADNLAKVVNEKAELENKDTDVTQWKEELKALEKAKEELYGTGYEDQVQVLQRDRAEVQQQLKGVEGVLKQRGVDEKTLKHTRESLTRAIEKTDKLNRVLNNPGEPCPLCGAVTEGKVNAEHVQKELNSTSSEVEILASQVKSLEAKLEEPVPEPSNLKNVLSEIDSRLSKLKESKKYDSDQLSLAIGRCREKINEHEELEKRVQFLAFKIQEINTAVTKTDSEIQELEAELVQMEANPVMMNGDNLAELDKKRTAIQQDKAATEKLRKDTETYLGRINKLKDGFKEVKSYVFNSVLNEINVKANRYLQDLFEMPATLSLVNDNMKIQTNVTLDGKELSLGLLSGGQNRRFCLSIDLALADVVLARKGSRIGMLILDEYFKDLSEQSMEKCLEILQKRGGSTVLIEHNSIFKSIVDNTFSVKLSRGTTRVEV